MPGMLPRSLVSKAEKILRIGEHGLGDDVVRTAVIITGVRSAGRKLVLPLACRSASETWMPTMAMVPETQDPRIGEVYDPGDIPVQQALQPLPAVTPG